METYLCDVNQNREAKLDDKASTPVYLSFCLDSYQ